MPVSKEYTVKFPIVVSAEDYHEFNGIAEVIAIALNDEITHTEIGFDYLYYAAIHPMSYIMDTEELQLLQRQYNLSAED